MTNFNVHPATHTLSTLCHTRAEQQKACPCHAHAYVKRGRQLTFTDPLELVEEEMAHNEQAIHATGGTNYTCDRLLRRRQHLEAERERHIRHSLSRQKRAESRRHRSSRNIDAPPEQHVRKAGSVKTDVKQHADSSTQKRNRSLIIHETAPNNRFAKAA